MPFVILSTIRTGSHYLGTLLDSHPDLTVYGEICLPLMGKETPSWPLPHRSFAEVRNLSERFGYLLKYAQLRADLKKEHWGTLEAKKIIHLVRRDIRAHGKSWTYMDQNDGIKRHSEDDSPCLVKPLKEQHLEHSIRRIRSQYRWVESYLPSQTLEISYEEISGPLEGGLNFGLKRCLHYLGVDPHPLSSSLQKLRYQEHA